MEEYVKATAKNVALIPDQTQSSDNAPQVIETKQDIVDLGQSAENTGH